MKESVKEFVSKMMSEIRLDIDVEYCKKHNIKLNNTPDIESEDEIWDRLTNKDITKRAFDTVTKNKNKNE